MDARGGYEQSSCLSGSSAIVRLAREQPANSGMILRRSRGLKKPSLAQFEGRCKCERRSSVLARPAA